jgi:D-amino peptidase
LKNYDFDKIIFLGYHAMEGTMGGVLAHTFSSVNIQYVRLNGKDIGELYTDSAIASDYGIAPIFIACDDICLKEMQRICPDIEYVITKYGERRNRARLRESDTVLREMYDGVRRAMTKDSRTTGGIPKGSELEVRFTRAEYAEEIYEKTRCDGMIPVSYGGDTHTLKFTVDRANQIQKCL